MAEASVQELAVKIDQVREAIQHLEKRLDQVAAQRSRTIRTGHPHIVRTEGVCGGRPIIEGTRLSVKLIVGWTKQGMAPAEIAAMYPEATVSQIVDALAYYEDHPEEIEAEFAEEKRYLEKELPRIQNMIAERRES